MIIISPSFEDKATIPRKFTCQGGDINPELHIQNVSPRAKSLALILHDPDAPVAGGFVHWVVWNIDPMTTLIKEESVPPGASEGLNDAGVVGYKGPCPPPGMAHSYHFMVYALDVERLDLSLETRAKELEMAMKGHVIEMTEMIGLYERDMQR